jgi:glycosyltransferase involved in cell wall biosynthesis
LRVLHITATDRGGAGAACIRLHHALRDLQVDSRVLVRRRLGSDRGIVAAESRWIASLRYRLDRLPLLCYHRRRVFAMWSVNWLPKTLSLQNGDWEPDIVHIHWIGDGFVPVQWLQTIGKPIVWTMHDMWPFTGGCHYAGDCERYQAGCGVCPQLGSRRTQDLSSASAARKARAWKTLRGTAVSPGPWLATAARHSAVLKGARIEVIPNGLDGSLFKPGDRAEARRELNLRLDDRVILTGAVGAVKDSRKGFTLLAQAIRQCAAAGGVENWRLLVFGSADGPGAESVGIPVTYCGTVNSEQDLPRIYRAADVYTLPSLQDNLPNTVVESIACGTPVVAFRSSGLAAMIRDGITGRLAEPFSTKSLAAALRDALNPSHRDIWSHACREEFERTYAWPGPALRYIALYNEMLKDSGNGRE